jgi:hypothetical protein
VLAVYRTLDAAIAGREADPAGTPGMTSPVIFDRIGAGR